ncbi:MAG: NACHT domain-containing protein, partial [Chloroflexota bacterium]|nr:NACHT domain-containing protein [Chloroflexota bacterium]
MPQVPALSDLRAQLDATFDDPQLDAFCLDHFPKVFDQFGRGLRRDEKITLLLDHCRRKGCLDRLARLLQPDAVPALNPTHLAAYLDVLRGQCARLETRPYKQLSELRGAPPCLTLLETYEPLRFDLHPSRAGLLRRGERLAQTDPAEFQAEALREGSQLDVGLPTVLAAAGHVVLLGQAGSGKTTVLRLITAVLAAADPALAAERLALTVDPLPIPVLVALREFEYACQTKPQTYTRDVAGLLRFLDDQFQRRRPDRMPPDFVSGLIRAGRAWILLDALDEVADFDHRIAVRQAIEQLAGAFPGNRLLVTARVAAYEHTNTHLDERFNLAYVRDLTREQWAPLVKRLYAGLETNARFAVERAEKLLACIDGSATLQEMVKTPLMVWTATLIHYADRALPEQRAELYAAYVDVLLGERLHEEEGAEAAQSLRDARWPADDRRLYLTYAAFKTHAGAAQERSGEARRRDALAVVDETTLVRQILAPIMVETMMLDGTPRQVQRRSEKEARDFLKLMAERSGLLYARAEGYTFGDHLTLQEFLTALYLV